MHEGVPEIPKNPHEGRLIFEVAQEEAALMQAFLEKIIEEEGRVLGGKSPSAADYDNALVALEELREIAQEEEGTRSDKIDRMMSVISKAGTAIDVFMDAFATSPDSHAGRDLREKTDEHSRISRDYFTGARQQLEELRDRAHRPN
jgi:hypothetical protein